MRKAFSLLELSIAVGVISILLSMVIVSREFITNARLKKLMYEIHDVETATKSFYDIYNGLPGDLDNATAFFDDVVDGNGNEKVEMTTEVYNAMMHLGAADLIIGDYQANEADYAYHNKAKSGIVMRLIYTNDLEGFYISDANVFQLGQADNADNAIFTPEEAEYLDYKFDDSRPKLGRVTFRNYGTSTELACTNETNAYYVASKEVSCNLVFAIDFL